MGTRLDLHEIFCSTLGSRNVYFQPPETIKMNYPCIVYERASNDTRFADNRPYKSIRRYTATIIDKNPDSQLPDKLGELPLCRLNRVYTADNLNHYVFDIYF
nr:MAG TPA: tail completion protein [Caudoviricetes sp.]